MELDGTPLADPDARAQAFRFAEELEDAAISLEPEMAAEMLVKAAEVHKGSLGDPLRATSLLRRALHADPRCMPAIVKLKAIAEEKNDWPELSNVLDIASKAVSSDEQRAHLIAQRGDIVGRKLGRIAEARGLYREAARLTNLQGFKEAALQAASRIESILSERRPLGSAAAMAVEWVPVSPGPITLELPKKETVRRDRAPDRTDTDPATGVSQQFFRRAQTMLERNEREGARALIDSGLHLDPDSEQGRQLLRRHLRAQGRFKELVDALISLARRSRYEGAKQSALLEAAQIAAGPLADVEKALELYRECLAKEPVSEQAFAEAIARGVGQGILDVARRVLPDVDPRRRAVMMEELVQAATVASDERAAREFRAAAFEDAPGDARNFQAAVEVLRSRKDEGGLIHVLELRRRAVEDPLEKRAIAFELASMLETQGQAGGAAEALLDSIRLANGGDDISDALLAIDRLSIEAKDRTLATRAQGAAAAREGLSPKMRARHLRELARILRDELGDEVAADAALQEAEASLPAREDTGLRARPQLDSAAMFGPLQEDASSPSKSPGADDWAQAIALTRSQIETLTPTLEPEDGEGDLPGWSVGEGPLEVIESVRPVVPLSGPEEAEGTPKDEPPTVRIVSRPPSLVKMPVIEDPLIEPPVEQTQAIELSATVPAPVRTAADALRAGALREALELLAKGVVSADPSVTARAFMDAAELAETLGCSDDAQACLQRALGLKERPRDRREEAEARRILARLFSTRGEHAQAADALEPLLEADETGRAGLLLEIGRLRLEAKDLDRARARLEEALALDPSRVDLSIDLLRVHGARKDARAVAGLAERAEASGRERSAAWFVALGEAKESAGDPAGARDAFLQAMIADRVDLVPAERLLAIAAREKRSDWVDEALREMRARAIEQDARSRAYLVAGVLVARNADREEDRLTFESLKLAFTGKPLAPLLRSWIARWLEARGPSAEGTPAPSPTFLEPIPLEGTLREVLEPAQRALGVERLEVMRLEGGGTAFRVRPGDVPTIGVPQRALETRFKKSLRFDLSRTLGALLDPRLMAALERANDADDADDPALRASSEILDRVGLILTGDAAIALEAVGPKTARGEALAIFAASREIVDRWAEIGLAIDRTRPGV